MRNGKRLRRVVLGLIVAVLCVLIWVVAPPTYGGDPRKTRAHLACQSLSYSAESYRDHPANTKHEYPRTLSDLRQPPWGGPSFLNAGLSELRDPWGRSYQLEYRKHPNG
jgi:hypothetical protein